MTQTERIAYYEDILNRAEEAVSALEKALEDYLCIQPEIEALERYYTSDEWKNDYMADEAGTLPDDLRRGVLSQDAVYDLLERNSVLKKEIKE